MEKIKYGFAEDLLFAEKSHMLFLLILCGFLGARGDV